MNPIYHVTAVGVGDPLPENSVLVPDLEEASVTVSFDRIGCIVNVVFDGRPRTTSHWNFCLSAGRSLPRVDNRETEEVCHRISLAWLKAQTRQDVLGKDLFFMNEKAIDQRRAIAERFGEGRLLPHAPHLVVEESDDMDVLMSDYLQLESYANEFERRSEGVYDQLAPEEQFGFFFPQQDPDFLRRLSRLPDKKQQCLHTARAIATLYVNRCKVLSNLFVGDKEHNRCAGAMAYVLHKYIVEGKERHPTPFTISLNVEGGASQKKAACFHIARKWLNTNEIVIETWDMLLDLYFSCNYDESYISEGASSRSREAFCNAKKMFRYTY